MHALYNVDAGIGGDYNRFGIGRQMAQALTDLQDF
jgi:hypothetical protein